jgi:hypothetical protein
VLSCRGDSAWSGCGSQQVQQIVPTGAVGQGDVDRWLTTGPPRRYAVAAFLAWAARHHQTSSVTVPQRRVKGPGRFLDDDQHTEQLQRCIHDSALPLDVRICGALALLFGLCMPSIARLTIDDVDQHGDDLYLKIGDKPVQLPPRLAELVGQVVDQQRDPSAVSCAAERPGTCSPA